MSFGRRTVTTFPTTADPKAAPQTRRGGYWLALITVPMVFVAISLVGLLWQGSSFTTWLIITPPSAVSVAIVAAPILLAADFSLRKLGWRKPWIFALVCGLALYGLCFVTTVRGTLLILLALVPGLCGGWVLGWSRR